MDSVDRVRLLFLASSMLGAGLGAGVPAVAAAQTAQAQTAQAQTAQAQTGIGELIVTAQKREEALQKAPLAISAYTGAERDRIGIDSVQDLTNFTPGLIYNTSLDRVSMRGIGRYTNQLSADSSVGVYEDGAFTTFTVRAGYDSLFIDRLEVLRGPQGTLYGRNSIGGDINVISQQPTDHWAGEVRGSIDTYGALMEEGAVSGPITDHVQFRLAGSHIEQDQGYFHNLNGNPDEGNNRNEWYGEAQLRGDMGSHFDWWAKAFAGTWRNTGGDGGGRINSQIIVGADGKTRVANALYATNFISTPLGSGFPKAPIESYNALAPSLGAFQAPGVTDVVTVNPAGANPANANIRNFYSLYPQIQDVNDHYGLTAHLTGHFSGFDIRYIGSAERYTFRERTGYAEGERLGGSGVISYVDPFGITIYPDVELNYAEYHWFTQNEVDLLSSGDGPLQWVVGLYNFNEGYKQPETVSMPGQAQLADPLNGCILTGGCGASFAHPNPNRNLTDSLAHMGAETFAGFSQADWTFAPTWKATLGLRYTDDSKWGDDAAQEYLFLPVEYVPLPYALTVINASAPAQRGASATHYDPTSGLWVRKLSGSWDGVTGVAGLQWQPDRDTNIYAKYSRGYKSGGFNAGIVLSKNPETNSEHLNDYQLGVKKDFGKTLQVNLDLFYDQYYDAQIPIGVTSAGVTTTQFYNLPEARTDGVELETVWQPIPPLQLMLNYAFDDTRVIRSGCVIDPNDPTASLAGATPGGCTGGAQNLKGDELPNAPRNKLALNATYTWSLATGTLSLSGSYLWRDAQYGQIFTRPQYQAPSWDQVDLRLEYKPAGGHWTAILCGKNIFNTTGYLAGADAVSWTNGTFLKEQALTPPAIGELEVQYKF